MMFSLVLVQIAPNIFIAAMMYGIYKLFSPFFLISTCFDVIFNTVECADNLPLISLLLKFVFVFFFLFYC